MRINKFLSSLGIASRRAIDKYIEEGRIKVNGVIASTGIDVTEEDEIYIDNKKIETNRIEEKVYFMLNKPLEVLSASSDDRGILIFRLPLMCAKIATNGAATARRHTC